VGEKLETKITSNHNIKTPYPTKIKAAAVLDKKVGPVTPAIKKNIKCEAEPRKSAEVKTEEVK